MTHRAPHKIALADPNPVVRGWLKPALRTLDAEFVEVETGDALEAALYRDGPFHLVVTSARLPGQSGLQVLAAARGRGDTTPFIVVTTFREALLRVMVSDAQGTVLSSRVVDGDNLAVLARGLIERHHSTFPPLSAPQSGSREREPGRNGGSGTDG